MGKPRTPPKRVQLETSVKLTKAQKKQVKDRKKFWEYLQKCVKVSEEVNPNWKYPDSEPIRKLKKAILEKARPKEKKANEEKKAVAKDTMSSSSEWTVQMFKDTCEEYIYLRTFENEKIEEIDVSLKVLTKYRKLCKVLLVAENFQQERLAQIFKRKYPEATTRVFIDALMEPILEKNKMKIKHEEIVNADDLPTSKMDYVLYNEQNEILGCIETKARGALIQKSVIQCIMQLVSLSTKTKHSLVGVVTDGYKFVFLIANEQDQFGPLVENESITFEIQTAEDLKTVANYINTLLKRANKKTKELPQSEENIEEN